jgi:hypothetical protein
MHMMMSMNKILKDKHITKKRSTRAGLALLLVLIFLTVLMLAGCYSRPYQEVRPLSSRDTNRRPRAPITQVFFYPKSGQTTDQQARDHFECYNWSIKQTGFDPSQSSIPSKQRVRVVPMPPAGHDTAVLAITGAVLGALIAGPRHAAGGALLGATSGAIAGAASDSSRQQTAEQLEEAYSNSNQGLDAQYEGRALEFRRAMSACLEGRGYAVE